MAQVTSHAAIRGKTSLPFLSQLPPFPAVAAKLLGLVTSPKVQFREVADLVRTDPAFTARALRLANSPLMGGREVTSILHALSILGSERLNSLVMTLAVHQLISRDGNSGLRRRCWHHCLATALLAETLAPQFPGVISDYAYTAGLLHDLGCLVFSTSRTHNYEELLREIRSTHEQQAAETRVYGLNHSELGAILIEHWQLPSGLRPILLDHHQTEGAQGPLLHLIQWADSLAKQIGFTVFAGPAEDPPQTPPGWVQLPCDLDALCLSVSERINRLECSLM